MSTIMSHNLWSLYSCYGPYPKLCCAIHGMIHGKICTSFCLQVPGTKVIFMKSFRLLFMLPCYFSFFGQFLSSPHSSKSYTFLASVCLWLVALWIPSLSTLISITHFTLYGDLLLERSERELIQDMYLNFTQCKLLFRSLRTALPSSGPWLT